LFHRIMCRCLSRSDGKGSLKQLYATRAALQMCTEAENFHAGEKPKDGSFEGASPILGGRRKRECQPSSRPLNYRAKKLAFIQFFLLLEQILCYLPDNPSVWPIATFQRPRVYWK
jgi:hypothetical protein